MPSSSAAAMPPSPTAHTLPFVVAKGDKVNFWNVTRTSDYQEDCAQGRAYGDALLAYMREHNDPVTFGSVVRAMIENGVYSAIEIGFCSRLGINLIAGCSS